MTTASIDAGAAPVPVFVLAEPHFVLRRTVCSVAAALGIATIVETHTPAAAAAWLRQHRVDGLIASFDDFDAGTRLVGAVRAGETACASDMPVVVMLDRCGAAEIEHLKALAVSRILLKPFKIKSILGTVDALAALSGTGRSASSPSAEEVVRAKAVVPAEVAAAAT